jgi:CBS-domain-containing membrane protein
MGHPQFFICPVSRMHMMNSAIERLLSLRIKDVRNPHVVRISEIATKAQAAKTLENHDITGAPVVDREGRCIGVLSRSDFVPYERVSFTVNACAGSAFDEPTQSDRTVAVQIEPKKEDLVCVHMSPLVKTISDEASILNASRVMCGEHIHRLVTVDDQNRPTGVISTLDLVAAMIAAVEE